MARRNDLQTHQSIRDRQRDISSVSESNSLHYNFTTASATNIYSSGSSLPPKRIVISNVHLTVASSLLVYLTDGTSTYYLLKNVILPAGHTLILDDKELSYNSNKYSLYFKLNSVAAGEAVDVSVMV